MATTKESPQRAAGGGTVERRLEVETICFSADPAPATGGFAVRVTCNAKRSFELVRGGRRRRRAADVLEQAFKGGGGGEVVFPVADAAALRSEAACRGALRRMLASLPQLQALGVDWEEEDAVVPGYVVSRIVAEARRARGGDGCVFGFALCVRRRVVLRGEDALLMACKQRPPGEHDGDSECAICFAGFGSDFKGDDRAEHEPAVEMPACKHAFHRRCISEWFAKATTCPLCRDDVKLHAMREFM